MYKKASDMDRNLQNMALMLAVTCVRNTIIEEYHAEGRLSDPEMKAFNIEVANKLYTAFQYLNNPKYEADRENYLRLLGMHYPYDWDKPEMDVDTMAGLKIMRDGHG